MRINIFGIIPIALISYCSCTVPNDVPHKIEKSAKPPTEPTWQGSNPSDKVIDFDFKQPQKLGYRAPESIYPEAARLQKIEGIVELRVLVNPEGIPISAEVVNGPESLLKAAQDYALTLSFGRSRKHQKTEQSTVIVGIIFKLPDS